MTYVLVPRREEESSEGPGLAAPDPWSRSLPTLHSGTGSLTSSAPTEASVPKCRHWRVWPSWRELGS